MRFTALVLCAFAVATIGPAQAAPLVKVRAEAERGKTIEVSATEATTSEQVQSTAAWASAELETVARAGAAIRTELLVAEPGPDGAPQVTPLVADAKSLRGAVSRLFNQHYRVTFTLVRGLANSSVVSWGLILSSHVSVLSSLPVGLVAGGMSAGFQYFNKPYQDWLMRSKTPVGRLGRSFLVNIGYLSVAKATAAISGVAQNPNLLDATRVVLQTAFLGTLAQGTWNLGVAESSRIATEKNPERSGAIRRMNDFKTLSLSMVSTALSVANLVGAPLTDAGMIVMAGTGAVYYAWSMLKARRWAKEKLIAETNARLCASQLVP